MFVKRKSQEMTAFSRLAVGAVFLWPGTNNALMKTVPFKGGALAINAVYLNGSDFIQVYDTTEVVVLSGAFVEEA